MKKKTKKKNDVICALTALHETSSGLFIRSKKSTCVKQAATKAAAAAAASAGCGRVPGRVLGRVSEAMARR